MINVNSGYYCTTRGRASTTVLNERVYPTFMSFRIRLGGDQAGIECDVDIGEDDCIAMLEKMRARRAALTKEMANV